MVASITEKIVNRAILGKYITEEQHDEYIYALTLLLNILIADISVLIIGCAMHMMLECILFVLIYKLLRKYCGGYHFDTSLKCYISSCLMCPVALLVVRYVPFEIWGWSSIVVLSAILLFIISPVPALNKPLDEKEIVMFGKVARVSIFVIMSAYIIAVISNYYTMAKVISLATVFVAFFAVLGKMQLKYYN